MLNFLLNAKIQILDAKEKKKSKYFGISLLGKSLDSNG